MALQWMILAYVVAAEAALAVVLTLPSPKLIRSRIVSIISLILQPSLFVIPFAGFQLMGMCLFGIHKYFNFIMFSRDFKGIGWRDLN